MVSPQKSNGFIGIANTLWDEIIRRDFTKRQKDILMLILRLSYGCNRKVALIPLQKDFALCGLGGKGHVGEELKYLEQCKVIMRGPSKGEYSFNKNYELWQVTPVRGWDDSRFDALVHLNLVEARKERKVTETGTFEPENDSDESYQNGDFEEEEKLPKQGLLESGEIPVSGTFEDRKSPFQGPQVPVSVTETAPNPLLDAGYSGSKDTLNTLNNKDSKDYISEWLNFYKIKCKGIYELERACSFIGTMDMELIEICMKRSENKGVPYFEMVATSFIHEGITTLDAWKKKYERPEKEGRLDFIDKI